MDMLMLERFNDYIPQWLANGYQSPTYHTHQTDPPLGYVTSLAC